MRLERFQLTRAGRATFAGRRRIAATVRGRSRRRHSGNDLTYRFIGAARRARGATGASSSCPTAPRLSRRSAPTRFRIPAALSPPQDSPHIRPMAKTPDTPKKSKDRARPTRAKASRPDAPPTPEALAELLNPGIARGTAGLGSGTGGQHARVTSPQGGEVDRAQRGRERGDDAIESQAPSPAPSARPLPKGERLGEASGLQPPSDNSWDRRRDFSAAHTARKSAKESAKDADKTKSSGFEEARQSDYDAGASPITGLDPRLAAELGLGDEADASSPSPRARGEGRGEGQSSANADPLSRPHKPVLDEMGIATWHEFKPSRPGDGRPRKPNLDEMGPGVESIPGRKGGEPQGPRSKMGRPGMRGGFKKKGR